MVSIEEWTVDTQTSAVEEKAKEKEVELRTLNMETFGFALLLRFGLL